MAEAILVPPVSIGGGERINNFSCGSDYLKGESTSYSKAFDFDVLIILTFPDASRLLADIEFADSVLVTKTSEFICIGGFVGF